MTEEEKHKLEVEKGEFYRQLSDKAIKPIHGEFPNWNVQRTENGMKLFAKSEHDFGTSDLEFCAYVVGILEKFGGKFTNIFCSDNKFSCDGKWEDHDVKVMAEKKDPGIELKMDFSRPASE